MEIQDGTPRPGKMYSVHRCTCYNEQAGLREFHHRMTAAARTLCGQRFELILIDDGSTDNTWKLISQLSAEDRNVVAVRLFRNHGHQLALTAGLSTVPSDLVLVIDADFQDPPELLTPMYEMMAQESADVVHACGAAAPAKPASRRNRPKPSIACSPGSRGSIFRSIPRLPADQPAHLRPARADAGARSFHPQHGGLAWLQAGRL